MDLKGVLRVVQAFTTPKAEFESLSAGAVDFHWLRKLITTKYLRPEEVFMHEIPNFLLSIPFLSLSAPPKEPPEIHIAICVNFYAKRKAMIALRCKSALSDRDCDVGFVRLLIPIVRGANLA